VLCFEKGRPTDDLEEEKEEGRGGGLSHSVHKKRRAAPWRGDLSRGGGTGCRKRHLSKEKERGNSSWTGNVNSLAKPISGGGFQKDGLFGFRRGGSAEKGKKLTGECVDREGENERCPMSQGG